MSDLIQDNLLERRFISGRPHIALTEKGERVLREEHALLGYLLGDHSGDATLLRGHLSGGLGEGGYYIGQEGYLRQIEEKFSFAPYRGTFNITVSPEFLPEFEGISIQPAVLLEGFRADARSFGEVRCLRGEIRALGGPEKERLKSSCVILQPRRTHHSNTLELLAPGSLRSFFDAVDGDEFEVTVFPHMPSLDGEEVITRKRETEGARRP
jgi:riboflavin kinase